MLALLSPAKKLDLDTDVTLPITTQPEFQSDTKELVNQLSKMPAEELGDLMKLSEKLAELNYDRYRDFKMPFTNDNAKAAVFAFQGDTYVGLDVDTMDPKKLPYLQDHVRILSGLYGILRPLDLMQAYRLEMGTRLENARGKNLYDFWGDKLTTFVNDETKGHKNRTVINLASNEYISAIQPDSLEGGMITPQFKEMKDGKPKMIGIFAKRARGMMARYMVDNKIDTPEGLKDFNVDGYQFQQAASNDAEYVFLRDQG